MRTWKPALRSTSFVWVPSNCEGKKRIYFGLCGVIGGIKLVLPTSVPHSHTWEVGARGGKPWLGHPRGLWPRLLWSFLHSASRGERWWETSHALLFWACWLHFSGAHGWLGFWKAFRQPRYVCSPMSPPERQCSMAGMEPDPRHPTPAQRGVPGLQHCVWGHVPACWEPYKT